MPATCDHLDQIHDVSPSDPGGCTDCLATGDRWVHLRLCLSCGHVGCCDSSPNHHASRHSREAGHAIAASFEPDEDWAWCYVDDVALDVSPLHLPHRDPYPGEA
jgi:uncharacterized UBP type Zn finger protein